MEQNPPPLPQQQPPSNVSYPALWGLYTPPVSPTAPPMAGLKPPPLLPPSTQQVTEVSVTLDQTSNSLYPPPQFPPPPLLPQTEELDSEKSDSSHHHHAHRHLLTPHPQQQQLKPLTRKWGCLIYTQPSSIKGKSLGMMLHYMAMLSLMIALTDVVISTVSAAGRSGTSSTLPPLTPIGTTAVMFGMFTGLIMFVSAAFAFASSKYADTLENTGLTLGLPICGSIYIVLLLVALTFLVISSITASVEARRNDTAEIVMTVLCVVDAAVSIPVVLLNLCYVTISIFFPHNKCGFCSVDDI